jgi:hypothetical protein
MGRIRDYLGGQFKNDSEEEDIGINGFTTAARVREIVKRSATIPVTFLENGTHINDHIIRDPLVLTIEGNVSDTFVLPNPAIAALQAAQTQVGSITQYAPARTQAQLSRVSGLANDFINAVDRVDSFLDASDRAAGYLGLQDDTAVSNIQKFIDDMEAAQASDQLISIDMPFKTYKQMYITSLETTRNNETNALDFVMELMQFQFAETLFADTGPAPDPSGNTNGQTEGSKDKGVQEGKEVPQSVLSSVGDYFGVSF